MAPTSASPRGGGGGGRWGFVSRSRLLFLFFGFFFFFVLRGVRGFLLLLLRVSGRFIALIVRGGQRRVRRREKRVTFLVKLNFRQGKSLSCPAVVREVAVRVAKVTVSLLGEEQELDVDLGDRH